METALAFVGAVVLSWYFLCFLVCVIVWNVHVENDGWAIIYLAAFAAIAYFFFTVAWQTLAIIAAVYVPVGLLWSMYRWKRHCKSTLEEYNLSKDKTTNSYRKDRATEDMTPSKNVDRIATWVIIWPFSFIDNIIGDLIDAIRELIKKYLIRIYDTIAGKYLDQLK